MQQEFKNPSLLAIEEAEILVIMEILAEDYPELDQLRYEEKETRLRATAERIMNITAQKIMEHVPF